MNKQVEQLIKDIIIGAEFANGNPDVGDWVDDLYTLASITNKEQVICKSCGLAPCKCDVIEDRRKYGHESSWLGDRDTGW